MPPKQSQGQPRGGRGGLGDCEALDYPSDRFANDKQNIFTPSCM